MLLCFSYLILKYLIIILILKSPDHYKTILIKDGSVNSIEEQDLTIEQSESSRYEFSKFNLLSLQHQFIIATILIEMALFGLIQSGNQL
jgi:hypothetical protein